MRVIAGILGGRQFSSPRNHKTRPMSDKVRGALFNTLGEMTGLSVLDAFAGSGALSFEAVSRGASAAMAIDSEVAAQKAISESIKLLHLEKSIKLVKASAGAWLSTSDELFDVILLDPPYDNIQPSLLTKLAARAQIEGLVIISLPPSSEFELPGDAYALLSFKNYGDASIKFFRRLS